MNLKRYTLGIILAFVISLLPAVGLLWEYRPAGADQPIPAVSGQPGFVADVGAALQVVYSAGWGRYVHLNIREIAPIPEGGRCLTAGDACGGYLDPATMTVFVNSFHAVRREWLAGMLVHESCHQHIFNVAQVKWGYPSQAATDLTRSRWGEFACDQVQQAFYEAAGIELETNREPGSIEEGRI